MRMDGLERVALVTTPVLNPAFLTRCCCLLGQDWWYPVTAIRTWSRQVESLTFSFAGPYRWDLGIGVAEHGHDVPRLLGEEALWRSEFSHERADFLCRTRQVPVMRQTWRPIRRSCTGVTPRRRPLSSSGTSSTRRPGGMASSTRCTRSRWRSWGQRPAGNLWRSLSASIELPKAL